MTKQLYRVFFFKYRESGGYEIKEMHHQTFYGTLEQIKNNFNNIYYLTDLNGDVIIDNRKKVNLV